MVEKDDALAARFEETRAHLRAVAFRMLGTATEADDAVQESWIRLSRTDTRDVENLRGWLTTVVARVCLDMLRARRTRREQSLEAQPAEPGLAEAGVIDHEEDRLLAESIGPALLIVLDTLAPAERLAFVLHDLFAVPFEEIAPIVGRTPTTARQLASRARRRVQGAGTEADVPARGDLSRQRPIVQAFLAAARGGDFRALLALLDPNVVVRADAAAVKLGAAQEVRGAEALSKVFTGRAKGAREALVDGEAGLAWVVRGKPLVVFVFTFAGDRVGAIDLIGDPAAIGEIDLEIVES